MRISVVPRLNEFLSIYSGLPQNSCECANFQLVMHRHNTTLRSTPKHDVAAALPQLQKTHALQHCHTLSSTDSRKFRHALSRTSSAEAFHRIPLGILRDTIA